MALYLLDFSEFFLIIIRQSRCRITPKFQTYQEKFSKIFKKGKFWINTLVPLANSTLIIILFSEMFEIIQKLFLPNQKNIVKKK